MLVFGWFGFVVGFGCFRFVVAIWVGLWGLGFILGGGLVWFGCE